MTEDYTIIQIIDVLSEAVTKLHSELPETKNASDAVAQLIQAVAAQCLEEEDLHDADA